MDLLITSHRPNLSNSSLKVYLSALRKLNDDKPVQSKTFLLDYDYIIDINSLFSCGVSHVMNNLIAASIDRKVLFIIHSLPRCLSTCHTKCVRLVAFRPWRWSAPLDRR